MGSSGFNGLTVAAFESRMADEMTRLIARYGGEPLVAPSMREIPLSDNHEALQFGEQLLAGRIDMLILLTGVGTRTLVDVLQTRHPRDAIKAALGRVTLVARGPKPVSALKELGLTPQITVPEPNTWRDILQVLDATVAGKRVAIQEYGVPNDDLLNELRTRGALVTPVPIYRWALPEDLAPLRRVLAAILEGQVAVVLVTNAIQVDHVEQVLAKDETVQRFRKALGRMVVASIGPTASEQLRSHGWPVDLEPSHPKMGILVKETSERAWPLLLHKRPSK
ncbi:MAG TPA: uroporphyrinogen-III synthase [Nitrospiraceae bacterium]|jgi:uroporphyrinogen-III synthase|nr:uroporphyrinogen-III synthase [Nitrospiraceae bacterium]